jgi:hypothetical protein
VVGSAACLAAGSSVSSHWRLRRLCALIGTKAWFLVLTVILLVAGAAAICLRLYRHPVSKLRRQAIAMEWESAGTFGDDHRYVNSRFTKDRVEVFISLKNSNVVVTNRPEVLEPFIDFLKLEEWLIATRPVRRYVEYIETLLVQAGGCDY